MKKQSKFRPIGGDSVALARSFLSVINASTIDLVGPICELIDNSIDKKAKKIALSFKDTVFSISDDGEGFGPQKIESCFSEMGQLISGGEPRIGNYNVGHKILYLVTSPRKETISSKYNGQNIEAEVSNDAWKQEVRKASQVEEGFTTTIRYFYNSPGEFKKYYSNIHKIRERLSFIYSCNKISITINGREIIPDKNLLNLNDKDCYSSPLLQKKIILAGEVIAEYSAGFLRNPVGKDYISGRNGYMINNRMIDTRKVFDNTERLNPLIGKERFISFIGFYPKFVHQEKYVTVDVQKNKMHTTNIKILNTIAELEKQALQIYNQKISEENERERSEKEAELVKALNKISKELSLAGSKSQRKQKKVAANVGRESKDDPNQQKRLRDINNKSRNRIGGTLFKIGDWANKFQNWIIEDDQIIINYGSPFYKDLMSKNPPFYIIAQLINRNLNYPQDSSIKSWLNDSYAAELTKLIAQK